MAITEAHSPNASTESLSGRHTPTQRTHIDDEDYVPSARKSYHSSLDVPNPGTRNAPKTFRGDAEDLQPFMRQFERMARLHGLTEAEKCQMVGDYCSLRVRETILGFDSYRAEDWENLRVEIEKAYDLDSVTKRYTISELRRTCKKYAGEKDRPLNSMKAWRHYIQDFYRVAGSLLTNKKISQEDFTVSFWKGIPKHVRDRVELQIKLELSKGKQEGHDMDRFDKSRGLWGGDSDSEELDDDSDVESNRDSDSESDSGRRTRKTSGKVRRREKPSRIPKAAEKSVWESRESREIREKGKGVKEKDIGTKEPDSARLKKNNQATVESLIEQMGKLSLNDPKYSLLYYKATKLDPTAQEQDLSHDEAMAPLATHLAHAMDVAKRATHLLDVHASLLYWTEESLPALVKDDYKWEMDNRSDETLMNLGYRL
ncbi:hypothetical protein BXZ70DRAFT_1068334 [Cristinia sonorae]|uniref:Uncharacterized protein n=1 Tax=Cristinia sonorae TaxID=1940300 RepID=A0A8K0XKE5_9AGAR|nr:hypothetical protein BXZ70DRAFT_1068334 [Cristinia sonorae]